MNDDEELQRDLTRVALTALDGRAFALAGSGAIREHGMVDRLTHDVDLFMRVQLHPPCLRANYNSLFFVLKSHCLILYNNRAINQV